MADDTVTFPRDFRPNPTILFGLIGLLILGVWGTWSVLQRMPLIQAVAPGLPTLVAVVGLVAWLRFTVRVDDIGITQRTIGGTKTVRWDTITRLDRMNRSYSVHDRDGNDLVMLSLLPDRDQKAIADEVIARCGLRPARQKPERPIAERWI